MIQACVIFYNDTPNLLERCFISLKTKVDKIIAIDGAFKEFSHDLPYSTDGSLEIAKIYAHEVIECNKPWKDQIEKRNAYLTLKDEKDYYFIIDADEWLETQSPKPFANLDKNVYQLPITTLIDGQEQNGDAMRLIRHQKGIRYQQKHSLIWVGKKIINRKEFQPQGRRGFPLLKFTKIWHLPEERPIERLRQDGEYLRNRKENNAEIPKRGYEGPPSVLQHIDYSQYKNYPRVTIKFIGNHTYRGMDFAVNIVLDKGQQREVTKKFADDVIDTWPGDWEVIKNANTN